MGFRKGPASSLVSVLIRKPAKQTVRENNCTQGNMNSLCLDVSVIFFFAVTFRKVTNFIIKNNFIILKREKNNILNTTGHFKEVVSSWFEVLHIVCPAEPGSHGVEICVTDTWVCWEMCPVVPPDNIPICNRFSSPVSSVLVPSGG